MTFRHPRQRPLVWLCIVAAMLLGLGAQLHGLSHALQTLKTLNAATHDEPSALHAPGCDRCLQFAALDGFVPTHGATALPLAACTSGVRDAPPPTLRAAVFTAYISRAPPAFG
jgi:hypothetical protein